MIRVGDIFSSLCESAKNYQAGMNPLPEFNDKLNESQKEIMDTIGPLYDDNERIRTLLDPFVMQDTGSATGTIAKPSSFNRVLGLTATYLGKVIPVYQAKENELIQQSFIPQRKADFSRGIAYYKQAGANIRVIPSDTVTYDMEYLRNPLDAHLEYEYTSLSSGEKALTEANVIDLEWNQNAYNLILNWLLNKYGIIDRDRFLVEISNYGISSDLINKT